MSDDFGISVSIVLLAWLDTSFRQCSSGPADRYAEERSFPLFLYWRSAGAARCRILLCPGPLAGP
eukprot:7232838-Prymnesium_polylepis.1